MPLVAVNDTGVSGSPPSDPNASELGMLTEQGSNKRQGALVWPGTSRELSVLS